MKKFIKNHLSYLFSGIAIWFPILIVILIAIFVFSSLENIGGNFLNLLVPGKHVFAGAGTLLMIIVIYITGFALKGKVVKKVISKVPILSFFISDGEKMTLEKLRKLSPCSFLSSPTCLTYGFILSETKTTIHEKNDEKPLENSVVNVYQPGTPTIITGQMFSLNRKNVVKLGNTADEIIKLILYSSENPPCLYFLPWPEEKREDFEKRIERIFSE